MKIEVTNGRMSIDLCALFGDIPCEDALKVADAIATTDAVVKYVAQQILDGWTERGSHAGMLVTASQHPSYGLDWACREVARRSSEVAAREIGRLEQALEKVEQERSDLYQRLCSLRGEIPR